MKPGDVVRRNDPVAWRKWQGNPPASLNWGSYGIVIELLEVWPSYTWFWVMWQDGTVEKVCNAWVEKVNET